MGDLCGGWNVNNGSCQLEKGHKGSHVSDMQNEFRATPNRRSNHPLLKKNASAKTKVDPQKDDE
jgi:hypothetical protein